VPTSLKTRLTAQPYFLFLLTGFILIIATFFTFDQTIDFRFHDTYLVVAANYFIGVLAILFFLLWGIYKVTDRFLWTKKLTWTHVSLTILVLILLAIIVFWHDRIFPPIKRDTVSFQDIIDAQKREGIITYTIMILFIVGQIAYFVNLIVGLIKRRL